MIGSVYKWLGRQFEAQHGIARPDMGIARAQHGPSTSDSFLYSSLGCFGGGWGAVGEHHRGVTRCKLVTLRAHFWAGPPGNPKTRWSRSQPRTFHSGTTRWTRWAQNPVQMRAVLSVCGAAKHLALRAFLGEVRNG
jgi:hypothetical protein